MRSEEKAEWRHSCPSRPTQRVVHFLRYKKRGFKYENKYVIRTARGSVIVLPFIHKSYKFRFSDHTNMIKKELSNNNPFRAKWMRFRLAAKLASNS